MVVELKTIMAFSKEAITVPAGSYKFNGVANTEKTLALEQWPAQLVSEAGGGLVNINREFNFFYFSTAIFELVNKDFADFLGLETGIYPANISFDSVKWGLSKLVIQNSARATGTNSVMKIAELDSVDFQNEVTVLAGFTSASTYQRENDKEAYKIEVTYFEQSKIDFVKDFLGFNGSGLSKLIKIVGLDWKIPESYTLSLLMSGYSGVKDQVPGRNYSKWEVAFIVESKEP